MEQEEAINLESRTHITASRDILDSSQERYGKHANILGD